MKIITTNLFDNFPRYPLLHQPTTIEPLKRLSNFLNGPTIFVKRDDQNEVGGGGNKLRKLEFLIGDALAKKADTVITFGAQQSNHARLTAAVAARAGLKCELILINRVGREDEDYLTSGNILLDKIFGATIHYLNPQINPQEFLQQRLTELLSQGRKVYVIPTGGSNPIGILGYVRCAAEIIHQSETENINFDQIIVPNGSSGTQAGLIAGFKLLKNNPEIILGYTVLDKKPIALAQTLKLAQATGKLIDENFVLNQDEINIDESQLGTNYGIPTDNMIEAVKLLARTEGLLIDPVYSGKAFAGLIQAIRNGNYTKNQNILFIMTGGLPGIYAYKKIF